MTRADTPSPREAAGAFTPELTALIESPLYDQVWADARLSARDRSLATVAACVVLARPAELRAQLVRAVENGVTRTEISALITHLAFYAGFPASVEASVAARDSIGPGDDGPADEG